MIITYEEWEEKYKPIKNKRGDIAFDTHNEEDIKFLRDNQSKDALNIWTLVDSDDGESLFIDPGYRFVNRLEYYITEVSRENKDDFVQVEY